MLSKEEQEAYSRQLLLNEVGLEGQKKMKKAKVLVIGAGGLGCPVLQYLNAAGVGTLGIVDSDKVEKSNLHRQLLFDYSSVGKGKAEAAKAQLKKNNPFTIINSYSQKVNPNNSIEILRNYDIIVDCTDNYTARYIINDACVLLAKPLVYGAVYKFEGQVALFNHMEGATYRCLFPEFTNTDAAENCNESGVLGVLPGIIGLMQANEVLKLILNAGKLLSNSVLTYNGLTSTMSTLRIKRKEHKIYKRIKEQGRLNPRDYQRNSCRLMTGVHEVSFAEFDIIVNQEVQLIDVREEEELPKLPELKALNIPAGQITTRIGEINRSGKTIVFCRSGIRSNKVIKLLQDNHGFTNLSSLHGGVESYIEQRDALLTSK